MIGHIRRNSDGGAPVTAASATGHDPTLVTTSGSFDQTVCTAASDSGLAHLASSSSSTPSSSPWKTSSTTPVHQSVSEDKPRPGSRRCSRNSGDSGEVAGDEVEQDSVRVKRDEVRRCRGQSRGSSLRTPKHTQAKLSYTAAVESDSDQETRLSSPHKPRRHSFREPRAPGGHMETRSQRSSPKNSLQTSDTMLMVSGGDRSTMRRHSAVSVLSDSATIAMVRRPSVVTSDHTGGQYPGRSRRQSGQSRRSSDDRVTGRRRSSVERMHGDNNITIVVSQDDINSNNNITRGERFKQSVFLEDLLGNLISAFKSIFQ